MKEKTSVARITLFLSVLLVFASIASPVETSAYQFAVLSTVNLAKASVINPFAAFFPTTPQVAVVHSTAIAPKAELAIAPSAPTPAPQVAAHTAPKPAVLGASTVSEDEVLAIIQKSLAGLSAPPPVQYVTNTYVTNHSSSDGVADSLGKVAATIDSRIDSILSSPSISSPSINSATFSGSTYFSDNVSIGGSATSSAKLSIVESSTGAGDGIIRFLGNGNNALGTVLGGFEFWNQDTSGSGANIAAMIKALSYNSTGAGGALAFYVHPQGSVEGEAATEAVRITGDGNVGIGTASPNNLLDVYSTSRPGVGFSGATDTTYKWTIGMDVASGGRFSIASSSAVGTSDRFVINGNGYVGIGTTAPTSPLTVKYGSSFIFHSPGGGGGGDVWENTCVGYKACDGLTSNGYANTVVGKGAAPVLNGTAPNGASNTIMGYGSAATLSTASFNTIYGTAAGSSLTTQSSGTYLGYHSGANSVPTGGNNTFVGDLVGRGASGGTAIGISNTAVGDSNMTNYTGADSTASFGWSALENLTSGDNNSGLGAFSLRSVNTGGNNIGVGYKAGDNLTSGSNNIIMGYDVDFQNSTGSNQLAIGNLIFGTSIDGTATTISTGNIGIGVTSPGQKLTVAGSVGFPGIGNGAGTAYLCTTLATGVVSTSTSACNPSSLKYKENIADLSYGLAEVLRLHPVSYDYKPELLVPGHQVGFVAEEMYNVVPEVVGLKDGEPDNIDYAKLTAVLAKAIQELNSKIDALSGAATDLILESISSHVVYTQELHIDGDVCVDDVCVTKDQFKDLLIGAGGTSTGDTSSTTPE